MLKLNLWLLIALIVHACSICTVMYMQYLRLSKADYHDMFIDLCIHGVRTCLDNFLTGKGQTLNDH